MSPGSTRPYRSPLRADQARATRRRIRDAADALFLARGYAATSMDDVAAAAEVARQTVFSAFGSKSKLLREVVDVRLAGDDAPVPLAERPLARRMWEATDPVEAIRLQAEAIVEVGARIAPLWGVLTAAAGTDPEIAAVVRASEEARLADLGMVVDVVAGLGALAPGRSPRRAKEAVWLLAGPGVVADALARGWSRAALTQWLRDCMQAVLLVPTTP
jgi:AcrR family transcriptional regulator